MKPCTYRTVLDDQYVQCDNHVDIVHNGILTLEICETCPYAKATGDFFQQTEDLLKTKQRTGEYKPLANPCGCSDSTGDSMATTIRREAYTPRAITTYPIPEPVNSDWAVVVTTAPRRNPTLNLCINSLHCAGWEPTVFAEPDSVFIPNIRWVSNPVRLGAWHNWLQAVRWALAKTPAKYIMTVQDDSLFHPDSRAFVETIMWPSHNTGFISLYTAAHYSVGTNNVPKPLGVNLLQTSSLWGACALVFSRSVLEQILTHPLTEVWTGIAPKGLTDIEKYNAQQHKITNPHLIQNVDTAIGRILNSLHLEMYVVDPSPVQHIAVHSAINHGNNVGKRNCSRCADHSLPLAEQVFPMPHKPKVVSDPSKLLKVFEEEIGYRIGCNTCLEYVDSLNHTVFHDVKDLVIRLYANIPFPNEWRKKHISRTNRLLRIEELVQPLLTDSTVR